MTQYYWEELEPGSVRDLGTISVSAEEIKEFAEQFELFNQNDEKVLYMEGYGMFGRRHAASAQELAQLEASRSQG